MTDSQSLLTNYVRSGSEDAFRELIARYLDLVHSAALRLVDGDTHRAEDVTQSVFADLARMARTLPGEVMLGGWLHRHTCFVAVNLMRGERRRQSREKQAVEMNALQAHPETDFTRVAPILDEAINELAEADRTAILLRFFEQQDFSAVGEALGSGEDAARMRVNRALEKLESLLKRRGVTASSGALSLVLTANAVQAAPIGLAVTVSAAVALAGTTAATTASAAATATKAIAMTILQKTAITATIAVLAGVGIYEARQASLLRARIAAIQQEPRSLPVSSNDASFSALQEKIDLLAAQNADLAGALAQANTDRARLATEREQAKRAAALYKELGELANPKDTDPTNAYPTERHIWVGWGRFGRIAALLKEVNGELSPEEKSALEAAQMKLLEEFPQLVKAAKQFAAAKSSSTERPKTVEMDEMMDLVTCLLYGALNLDEQQFHQVYGVMQKLKAEAKLEGISKESPEAAEAVKQFMDQWKAETQILLTPEQARIFAEVVTHFQVEPGNFGINFGL